MSLVYEDGEVVGGSALDLAVIAGAMFIILAALWTPVGDGPAAAPQAQAIEQVVVVAHPSHTS
jgi:hypothetical protein